MVHDVRGAGIFDAFVLAAAIFTLVTIVHVVMLEGLLHLATYGKGDCLNSMVLDGSEAMVLESSDHLDVDGK